MHRSPLLRGAALALAATLVSTFLGSVGGHAAGGPNLALGKAAGASSVNGAYAAGNLNDGNQGSYWESAGSTFPQWARIDLGAATAVDQVVLKLPTGWGARTQTLSVQSSSDGSTFGDVVASAAYAFNPTTGNAVTINFTAVTARYLRVNITANTGWTAAQLSEFEIYGTATAGTNLAQGRPTTESAHADVYDSSRAVDANQGTYWESANNAFPQWLGVDLGSTQSVGKVVLKVPSGWGTRTETLSVQGSTNGSTFSTVVASATYTFNPSAANTVTITFAATSARYLRVNVTANSAWPAGQISEFEVYAAGGGSDVTPPTTPGTLSLATSGTTITLTWGASTDSGSGLAGYDVFRDGTQIATLGNVLTYADSQPATATVSYFVRARDNAGNVSGNSNTATRTGQGDTTPPSVPGTLSVSTAGSTVILNWGASTDTGGSGLAGYNVYRDGNLIATLGTVLTYSDSQPATATVSYFVRARDGAGNLSGQGNTVTRTGTQPPGCTNVAQGKTVTASGSVFTFVPQNAVDGNVTTYWEGAAGYPATLTVALGANHTVNGVNVKLNPDSSWGTRTQNIQVLGRDQASSTYTSLVAAADYQFVQGSNVVSIPVSATTADVQLKFSSNTGAPSGQVAELEVCGTPAPNPDLTVANPTWTPSAPDETSSITLSTTVTNSGDLASAATTVGFYLNGELKGTANVGALNAGASAAVTKSVGTLPMGAYAVSVRVDPANTVFEKNETNNTAANPASMTVAQAPGPDLQVLSVSANPASPAAGVPVSFSVTLKNRGTTSTGVSTVTRVVVGSTTLDTPTAAVAAGATVNVAVNGSWIAVAGGATITATADATNVVAETNETNNSLAQPIVVGRGAAVPWTEYEAENANYTGTLLTADPLRTFGHTNFATESSGRKSVQLNTTGQYVEFTSTAATNSIVVRNSVPDSASGGGQDYSLSLYINGVFDRKLTLSSKFSWLYGQTDDTEGLQQTPQANAARRLFDESHALLSQSYPSGTKFKLQRDTADTASFYIIDFIDLEQVAPQLTQPAGCTSITTYGAVPNDGLDDTAAIQQAVMDDQNGVIGCVWIPAGQWRQEQKILTPDPARGQYNQKGIRNVVIRGAGMWYTQLYTDTEPQNVVGNINHPHEGNVGFDIDDNAQISDLAIFGATKNRANRGHGLNGRFGKNTKISNVWIEHTNVGAWVGRDYSDTPAYWNPADGLEFTGMRIRDTYADGINFSNGTRNSKVFNSSFRTTGDDSLAVWASTFVKDTSVDVGHDNHFTNNTIQLPWRANGLAIYGGYGNTIENNIVSDTMNYPGIMLATDHSPIPFSGTTTIANNALYRCGGVFWGEAQKFGAITLFAPSTGIPGVVIRDTDISDSTYDGIQFKSGGGTLGVTVTNVKIDKSNNGAGILAQNGSNGSATLSGVTITNSATGDIVIEPGSSFHITGS